MCWARHRRFRETDDLLSYRSGDTRPPKLGDMRVDRAVGLRLPTEAAMAWESAVLVKAVPRMRCGFLS